MDKIQRRPSSENLERTVALKLKRDQPSARSVRLSSVAWLNFIGNILFVPILARRHVGLPYIATFQPNGLPSCASTAASRVTRSSSADEHRYSKIPFPRNVKPGFLPYFSVHVSRGRGYVPVETLHPRRVRAVVCPHLVVCSQENYTGVARYQGHTLVVPCWCSREVRL